MLVKLVVNGTNIGLNTMTGTFTAAALNDIRSVPAFEASRMRSQTSIMKDTVNNVKSQDGVVACLGPFFEGTLRPLKEQSTYDDDASNIERDIFKGQLLAPLVNNFSATNPPVNPAVGGSGSTVVQLGNCGWVSPNVQLDVNFQNLYGGKQYICQPMDLTQSPSFRVYVQATALDNTGPTTNARVLQGTLHCHHFFVQNKGGKLCAHGSFYNSQRFQTVAGSQTAVPDSRFQANASFHDRTPFIFDVKTDRPENMQWIGSWFQYQCTNVIGEQTLSLDAIGITRIDLISRNITRPGALQAVVIRWDNLPPSTPITVGGEMIVRVSAAGQNQNYVKPTLENSLAPTEANIIPFAQTLFYSESNIFKRIFTGTEYSLALRALDSLTAQSLVAMLDERKDPIARAAAFGFFGHFDSMYHHAKDIVNKVAPVVMKHVVPVLAKAVEDKVQEHVHGPVMKQLVHAAFQQVVPSVGYQGGVHSRKRQRRGRAGGEFEYDDDDCSAYGQFGNNGNAIGQFGNNGNAIGQFGNNGNAIGQFGNNGNAIGEFGAETKGFLSNAGNWVDRTFLERKKRALI